MVLTAPLCNTSCKESKGDIEYITCVHISARELMGLHMNDLALWSFDQPWRSYSYYYPEILVEHLGLRVFSYIFNIPLTLFT